jgi:hypothetical protein
VKFKEYLKDKIYAIILTLLSIGIVYLIWKAYRIKTSIIISGIIIFLICNILIILIDYFRKKRFYHEFLMNIEELDKSYLVLETLDCPDFYEGKLLYQALYEINKSYLENVSIINNSRKDFKEYVEMWIHEVKIPLATLSLTLNNYQNEINPKIKSQIKRLEDYVDQVLYYVRSENAEKDYLIKQVDLGSIIKNIGIKNMDDLLENHIEFVVEKINRTVLSDAKWLEFILGQIINNAIKYKRNIKNSYIKIVASEDKTKVVLMIEDNGIGIKTCDIKQVFDKSFTGENGRIRSKSTGMGLYIAKVLCEKLGHKIAIESIQHQYTRVYITFAKNDFYETLK